MSSKTILDSIKAVTGELGFVQPQEVMASQSLTTVQLKYLMIAACDELLDLHDWQSLIETHTITTNGATSYVMPVNFHRMISLTAWNATTNQPMIGSANNAMWNQYVTDLTPNRFRIIGDQFQQAVPTTGETITFMYISDYYVIDGANQLPKAEFSLDSDKTFFHARLLINFLKLKMLQTKNLDTRAAIEDFNSTLQLAIGADSVAPILTTQAPVSDVSFEVEY